MRVRTLNPLSFRDRKKFIDVAWSVNNNNARWVPPLRQEMHAMLNPNKHPFHDHASVQLYLAEENRKGIGRIAAFVDDLHNQFNNTAIGFFGFFEAGPDQGVTNALVNAAVDFLSRQDCTRIQGPFNWSTHEECGVLVEGFDTYPRVMTPYNYPYYQQLLKQAGFQKAKNLYAYYLDRSIDLSSRFERSVDVLQRRYGFTVRPIDMSRFTEEVGHVQEIYRQSIVENWGEKPVTDREARYIASQVRQIIDPEICFFAEIGGEVVGTSLAFPDVNQVLRHLNGRLFPLGFLKFLWYRRQIDAIRVWALGVKPDHRRHGIDAALYFATYQAGLRRGYQVAELSWILEDNYPMRNALERLGAQHTKTFRIFELSLPVQDVE